MTEEEKGESSMKNQDAKFRSGNGSWTGKKVTAILYIPPKFFKCSSKKKVGKFFKFLFFIHSEYQPANTIYSTASIYLKSVQFSPKKVDHHHIPGLLPSNLGFLLPPP